MNQEISKEKKLEKSQGFTSEGTPFSEVVLAVDRVSRTMAGGRRIRFRALSAVGDLSGGLGIGIAKAAEVRDAVAKATSYAKKHMVKVPIVRETIPFSIHTHFGGANIILKPARQGSSIVAGGVIRTLAELAGIKNLSAKILGSSNKINNAKAVYQSFKEIAEKYHETSRVKKSS
ncbi:30S ribosomal protein S5 [Candidatus Berkelbacteria bacterium]|nr:30S ribosomal protein S5 [Candidatus Berkelbacteria bacterium]MBI4029972.1 30S ribosomal protein S5 [Candidatus Berkelbacteria bacterium]